MNPARIDIYPKNVFTFKTTCLIYTDCGSNFRLPEYRYFFKNTKIGPGSIKFPPGRSKVVDIFMLPAGWLLATSLKTILGIYKKL